MAACTRDTVRCPDGKRLHRMTPQCCIDHVTGILRELHQVLAEHRVRWWMDYGTLLGAVRNPLLGLPAGQIPHDKDGDISFFGEDWPYLKEALGIDGKPHSVHAEGTRQNEHYEWRGYLVIYKAPRTDRGMFSAGDSVKVCVSEKNRVNVDIFPWYQLDGQRYRKWYVGCDRYKGREFIETRLLPFTELPYADMMLPAPAEPEWFCRHRYGVDWMTPLYRNNDGQRR
jgi:fukutin-related protein